MENNQLKIFEFGKKHFASIDLVSNKRPFHRKQLLRIMISFLCIMLQILYLINDANTASEYVRSISIISIGILVFIAYWSAIFEVKTVYDFIDHYETIINGSELSFI